MTRADEDSQGTLSRAVDYTTLLVIGLLVIFTPVVLLVITMSFLLFAEGLDVGQLSALELLELYLIELGVVVVFGYLLFRVTVRSVRKHLPEVLDRMEDADDGPESTSRGAGSPEPRDDPER